MSTREPLQDSDTAHCIKNCFTCHRVCLETLHYCLSQKNTHFQGRHIAVLQLCAEASELSAKMMIADIPFHRQSCVLSFELSNACAEECERYEDDAEMRRCAEICRNCAESCRGMMGTAVNIPRSTSASGRGQRPQEINQ